MCPYCKFDIHYTPYEIQSISTELEYLVKSCMKKNPHIAKFCKSFISNYLYMVYYRFNKFCHLAHISDYIDIYIYITSTIKMIIRTIRNKKKRFVTKREISKHTPLIPNINDIIFDYLKN